MPSLLIREWGASSWTSQTCSSCDTTLWSPSTGSARSHGKLAYPPTLAMPGWTHLWGLAIGGELCQTTSFPQWVDGLLASIAFFRRSMRMTLQVRQRRSQGIDVPAGLLPTAKLPHFVEWRWKTPEVFCRDVLRFADPVAFALQQPGALLRRQGEHHFEEQGLGGSLARGVAEDWTSPSGSHLGWAVSWPQLHSSCTGVVGRGEGAMLQEGGT